MSAEDGDSPDDAALLTAVTHQQQRKETRSPCQFSSRAWRQRPPPWPSGRPGRGSYRLGDRGASSPVSCIPSAARPCSRDGGRRHAGRSDRRTRAVAGAGELPRRHGDRQRSASLPFVEFGIVCVGRRARRGRGAGARMPVTVAMALAAAFGMFHGHAHGAEMPAAAWPFSTDSAS